MTQQHKHGDLVVKTVTIRLTSETHRAFRRLAADNDMTVSAFFREYAEQITGRSGRATYREYTPHGG